ncbi:MAG: hypothetical protein FH753_12090 [Firmicutes bacterium]|nr:hypothetical protein [Bacillota bacterium]
MKIKICIFLFCFVSILLFGCNKTNTIKKEDINVNEKKLLDDIIQKYPHNNFNELSMEKKSRDRSTDTKFKNIEDSNSIKQLLSYFKNITLVKIDNLPTEVSTREIYEIDFTENEAYSKLSIEILNEEYLRILTHVYKKNYDKEKKLITYEEIDKLSTFDYYKVVDKKLDLEYIEKFFNQEK